MDYTYRINYCSKMMGCSLARGLMIEYFPHMSARRVRLEREKFVGAWNLVSYEAKSDDGRVVQPYGPSPYGRLMYDADGNMSVLLMASHIYKVRYGRCKKSR